MPGQGTSLSPLWTPGPKLSPALRTPCSSNTGSRRQTNCGPRQQPTIEFKTIDDVLEENAVCKEEILRLSDIIDEELDNLKEDVSTNKEAIVHIEDNFSAIASEVTLNTKHIGDNADEVQLTCLYNVE